jgi:hypothetical protein
VDVEIVGHSRPVWVTERARLAEALAADHVDDEGDGFVAVRVR